MTCASCAGSDTPCAACHSAVLADGYKGQLAAFASVFGDRMSGRIPCPDCGEVGPHDSNGQPVGRRSFICRGCGVCFDESEDS